MHVIPSVAFAAVERDAETEAFLRALPFQADFIGSAASWNVAKPDAGFFRRIVAEAGCEPPHITHIGDGIGNGVLPALSAGLHSIHIGRGP